MRPGGRYALLTIVALPTAAVAVWVAVLLLIGGSGSDVAGVLTVVLLAAPVAAAIWIGVRRRIRAWLIVVACVGAVIMWIPLVAVVFVVADAVDSGDSDGYYPGGVVVVLPG